MTIDPFVIFATVFAVSTFCLYLIYRLRLARNRIKDKDEALADLKASIQRMTEIVERQSSQVRELELSLTVHKERNRQLEQQLESAEEDEARWMHQFENLANRVIHRQSENLINRHSKGMESVLKPLKEKIGNFEDRVEKSHIEAVRRHESLKEQIKQLSEKSDMVSKDANNLAKALKGDFKKQGHWGELILESILGKSGLEKDREYFTQVSEKDDNGKIQRPDVIISLPDNKKLIIDSKVSLAAYSELVNADSEADQKRFRKLHLDAVRNHVDSLSDKRYHELYKIESPDFVLMFIPIDTAFSVALETDPALYNYAFEKNIVIVSSSTLLATLKTVESMWRNDKQNKYALHIADEAGKMYDKFAGFLTDMNKMGSQLDTVHKTYEDSMRKLYNGKGNLVNRAEKMKELGAKASKTIPASGYDIDV